MNNDDDFSQRLARVEALVERLEALPDGSARELSRELLATTLELHARGIGRLTALLEAAPELLSAAAADPDVRPLLLLHGLHPLALAERAEQALEAVRGRLAAAGAHATLLSADESCVRVALSAARFEAVGREALSAAVPDAAAITVEVLDQMLVQLGRKRAAG
jgi:hypothetical protein